MLYPPLSIHHFTKYNRHQRTHRRSHNSRPHNSRRIHTPILAPIRLCQAKTKKFLIFQEAYFFLHLSLGRKSLNLYTANPLLQSDAFYWIFSIIAISIPFSYRKNLYSFYQFFTFSYIILKNKRQFCF